MTSDSESGRPPRSPGPPAPPATGGPGDPPDPTDPGPPILVRLNDFVLGDLGNPRVDARLLNAVLLRGSGVSQWLSDRGVNTDSLVQAFPDAAGLD